MSSLPKSLNVAGINYAVREPNYVEIAGDRNYAGKCVYKEPAIEVCADLGEERKAETFVHEMLHAILFEAEYGEHDEELVSRAGRVLYQVLKDNDFSFLRQKSNLTQDGESENDKIS